MGKAWNKNLEKIISRVKDSPAVVFRLFLLWIRKNKSKVYEGKKILCACSSLRIIAQHVQLELDNRDIIIFGSGRVGDKLFEQLDHNIIAFVDNDFTKVGKYKHNIPIISFEEMVKRSDDNNIVIGVNDTLVYTLVCQLEAHGVQRYYISPVD